MTYAYILVYITVPSRQVGQQIAEALLGERLVACVNIVPQVTSIYRWQGDIHQDDELLLIAKTRAAHFEALAELVRRNHPYQVPEVIAAPLVAGSPAYLAWIEAETS